MPEHFILKKIIFYTKPGGIHTYMIFNSKSFPSEYVYKNGMIIISDRTKTQIINFQTLITLFSN